MLIQMRKGHTTSVRIDEANPFLTKLITSEDGFVDVCEPIAKCLVDKGVADYKSAPTIQQTAAVAAIGVEPEATAEGDLETMTKAQLVEIAKEAGVYKPTMRSKAQLIAAIEADDSAPSFE